MAEDLRTVRTKRALLEALLRLTEERGFERVTVSELCDLALVNRSTFYRYYEDKNDLLFRGTQALFDEVAQLSTPPPENPATAAPPAQLVAALEHVARHRGFYRAMLGPTGVPAYRERIEAYHRELIGGRIRANLDGARVEERPDRATVEYVIAAAAGAFAGIVSEWITNHCEDPAERIALTFLRFVASGMGGTLARPGQEEDTGPT